jgi:hypothetical protein
MHIGSISTDTIGWLLLIAWKSVGQFTVDCNLQKTVVRRWSFRWSGRRGGVGSGGGGGGGGGGEGGGGGDGVGLGDKLISVGCGVFFTLTL